MSKVLPPTHCTFIGGRFVFTNFDPNEITVDDNRPKLPPFQLCGVVFPRDIGRMILQLLLKSDVRSLFVRVARSVCKTWHQLLPKSLLKNESKQMLKLVRTTTSLEQESKMSIRHMNCGRLCLWICSWTGSFR